MSALLIAVQETAEQRVNAEADFRRALSEAHPEHSWREISEASGLSIAGTRYLVFAWRRENGR